MKEKTKAPEPFFITIGDRKLITIPTRLMNHMSLQKGSLLRVIPLEHRRDTVILHKVDDSDSTLSGLIEALEKIPPITS